MNSTDDPYQDEAPPIFETDIIDLARSFDRLYWPRRLRVTMDELKHAIHEVGPKAANIQRFLSGKPQRR